MDRLVVAGGGIGGVAAALALARKNISTIVLEQAPELGEIGAGIQIAPNAFHCFDRLGGLPEGGKGPGQRALHRHFARLLPG